MKVEGFEVDCSQSYKKALLNSFEMRLRYLQDRTKDEGINHISEDAAKVMEEVFIKVKKLQREEAKWES